MPQLTMDSLAKTPQKYSFAPLLKLAALLLIPSGCAALIYQVTWVRLLGLSMGSTSAAVSTVLAAFFCGMAIGSYFASRFSLGKRADLLAFAWLEIAIGVSGLVLLPALLNLDYGMGLLGESGSLLATKFSISLAVLAFPTICMGATFPVMASILVRHQSTMGAGLGLLYTLNTAGAVLGALLSGFVLIPRLGLDGAVYLAGGLNLLAAIGAFYFRKGVLITESNIDEFSSDGNEQSATEVNYSSSPSTSNFSLHFRIAIVLFLTGFMAIASEVAWTKYLSIFTGATLYGFSAILSIFLVGITSGSWAIKHYLQTRVASSNLVVWALIILAAALLFARVGLALLPALLDSTVNYEFLSNFKQGTKYLAVFIVIFPATFIFGALFPVTLSIYSAQVTNLQQRVGHAYAINTTGSILGSIAAGFWIIPQFGTDVLLSITVGITLALPWLFINKLFQQRTSIFIITAVVFIGVWQLPHLDFAKLIAANPYRFDMDSLEGKKPEFLFLEEGKAGVISVVTYDNKKARLQNNGIQESYIPLVSTVKPPFTEVLLGVVPYLLHPNPTNAFVVGYGGGNTVQALANTPLEQIRVVELEPAVISAVAAASGGEIALLKDSRIQLKINDARNSLLVEDRRYDLIVSQPSHPWLAGAGNLFTKQFFEIAAGNLNDGGIFTQWVNLFNMDATTLRSIMQAYYEVFPHGFTFANTTTGDLLLFGSNQEIKFDYRRIEQRMRQPAVSKALAAAQVRRPEDLLWYFSLSRREALVAAEGIKANTDTRIISEVRLAGMIVDPTGEESPYQLLKNNSSFDVLNYFEPNEQANFLFLAGRYFYSNFSTTRTRQAIAQLNTIDQPMAERLEKNWAAWRESFR